MSGRATDLVITSIPLADSAFRVHVDAALGRLSPVETESLQGELRKAYPAATVQVGDPLGSLGATRRWYVYRDGRSRRTVGGDDWWRDDTLPTTVVGEDGRYVDANSAAEELFGLPRASIVGAATGSFTRHEDDPRLGSRLFDTIRRTGELASTAVVVRPGGEEIPIEYHMRAVTPQNTYITVMRGVDRRG
jgi:PAS domain S-box-containing protein